MNFKKRITAFSLIPIIMFTMSSFFFVVQPVSGETETINPIYGGTITGYETQLTTDLFDQYDPRISGNIVVYTSYPQYSESDTWYYSLSTNSNQPVATGPGEQLLHDVSDGIIVYDDYFKANINMFNTSDGVTTVIEHASISIPDNPAIDKNLIAWSEVGQIYVYDLLTGEKRQITNSLSSINDYVDISNNIVVYVNWFTGGSNVYAYDWSTNQTYQIYTGSLIAYTPFIYNSEIVYSAGEFNGQNNDIYLYDLSTGTTKRLMLEGNQVNPHISGDCVTYDQVESNGLFHIYLWHLPTNTYFLLNISSTTSQMFNDIDGNRIVYSGLNDWHHNIYVFTFEEPSFSLGFSLDSINFGDIIIGSANSQIVTITNTGNSIISIDGISIETPNTGFTLTFSEVLPHLLDPGSVIEVMVTFQPNVVGNYVTNIKILTNVPYNDEKDILITGYGINNKEPEPSDQINDILVFFDQSVANGTLTGTGPGHSAKERLHEIRSMIVLVKAFINHDCNKNAKIILKFIYLHIDGKLNPQDFVKGPAAPKLASMIQQLIENLDNSPCNRHICHNH